MKVNEILAEGRDADLYHGTSYGAADQILVTNKIIAQRPMTTTQAVSPRHHSPRNPNWPSIVSFSRSMSVAAAFAHMKQAPSAANPAGVILVFDQALMYRDLGKRLKSYNDLQYISRQRSAEHEEALIGDFQNVDRYLKKIYVYAADDEMLERLQLYPAVAKHPLMQVVQPKQKRLPRRNQSYPTPREVEKATRS